MKRHWRSAFLSKILVVDIIYLKDHVSFEIDEGDENKFRHALIWN